MSASYPCLPLVCLGAVTIDTSAKSSANPCRSLGILFLVYSSNSLTTRFHRKGERIPPCGQLLLIAMVLRSPCSSTVVCRLWIIDIIHWLTSADLHFQSRALSIASKDTLSNAPSISRQVPSAIPWLSNKYSKLKFLNLFVHCSNSGAPSLETILFLAKVSIDF